MRTQTDYRLDAKTYTKLLCVGDSLVEVHVEFHFDVCFSSIRQASLI